MLKARVFLSAAALCALVAAGCNENTVDPVGGTVNTPTGLMATSLGNTSVGLRWNRSTSTDLTGYTVTVMNSSGQAVTGVTLSDTQLTSADSMVTVGGLTAGTVYTFQLRANGAGTTQSSPASITWSPAVRRTNVKLYASESSNGSGLELSSGSVLTVANGGRWDIALDDKGTNVYIGDVRTSLYVDETTGRFTAPAAEGAMAKSTLIGRFYANANGLDQVYDSYALDQIRNTNDSLLLAGINLNSSTFNVGNGVVFALKTQEGNFAKVFVKRINGKYLQGTTGNQYVEVDYSYQPTPNVPYALVQKWEAMRVENARKGGDRN